MSISIEQKLQLLMDPHNQSLHRAHILTPDITSCGHAFICHQCMKFVPAGRSMLTIKDDFEPLPMKTKR